MTSFNKLYESFIKPVLKSDQSIDAESLTNISLKVLGFSAAKKELPIISQLIHKLTKEFNIENKKLSQNIAGIDFCNPLGLAAGFDKNGVAASIWRNFGFGFSEIGTVTKYNQPGNPKPRLFRLANEEAALNRMGFNNYGADKLVKNLINQGIPKGRNRRDISLGINFGKSKITELSEAKEDYIYSLKLLLPYCDYAAINVSSPNTQGLRKLQDPKLLQEILQELKLLSNCPPLFVKIAPDLSYDEIDKICELINEENIEGIIATNTSLDRLGLENRIIKETGLKLSEEMGGLSGLPLCNRSNKIVKHIHKIDPSINLIGVGGINSPESAWERICSGASLIQIYTGWIYKGPQLVPDILKGLLKQIEIHKLSSIKEAVGSGLTWID